MDDLVMPASTPPDECVDCGLPRSASFRQSLTRGRCRNCYQRHVYAQKKAGTFDPIAQVPALERLLGRGVAGPGGCVIWTGAVNAVTGYGSFTSTEAGSGYAHRAAYELTHGPIPAGLVIDHVCHNRDLRCPGGTCLHRRCFNPHHLEAVTARENRVRSPLTKVGWRRHQTHCKRGHELAGENLRLRSDGTRVCRACHVVRQLAYHARQRAAAQAVTPDAALGVLD